MDAFQSCDMLEYLSIPRSVTTIGERAFQDCASLRTIQLPPSLREIGNNAFQNCISLTAIILPNGVRVGENTFQYCRNLRAVYALGMDSEIDPSAFRTCSMNMIVYAEKGTAGYDAARANGLLWAEIGGTPQRLHSPPYRQAAILHHEDASRMLPLYAEASESSTVLGWYPVGTTTMSFNAISDDWAKVALYQAEGYLPLSSLHLVNLEDDVERVLQVFVQEEPEPLAATPSPDMPQPDARILGPEPTYKRFYSAPTLDAPRIDEEVFGDQVVYDVVQRYGTWYVLANQAGQTCYVPVENTNPYSIYMAAQDDLYVVAAKGNGLQGHLYAEPDKHSQIIGTYYNGAQVTVPSDRESYTWLRRRAVNGFLLVEVGGQQGYMEQDALTRARIIGFYII
jgi:uncharacterized protein YgiM (DUF1202 family)